MKVNPWTMGLAAAGLVTLPAALQAEEKLNPILTAVTPTSLSGAVSTSIHWNPGTGNAFSSPRLYQQGKADGFNLDVVSLTLDKPLDESQWAAGYHVDLWFGPDANTFASQSSVDANGDRVSSDLAIKQAYVALRTPFGNGLEWKVGVFDSVIGYESHDSYKDPNYSRSYATSIEPHTHTGLLGSYQFSPSFGMSAGIANTLGPQINQRGNPPKAESYKTYMASLAVTAPDDWGFISGSTFYGGFVNGFNNAGNDSQFNFYGGVTLNTPINKLKVGAAYDYATITDDDPTGGSQPELNAWAITGYASYALTEKLSGHFRIEYTETDSGIYGTGSQLPDGDSKLFGITGTLQYDLWANVISRLEIIWDHQAGDNDMRGYGGKLEDGETEGSKRDAFTVALNLIYRF